MAFDADLFTKEARKNWNRTAPHYADLSAAYFEPITKAFLDFSGLKSGDKVLDLACGPGTTTLAAAKIAGALGRITGVDLSEEMLAIAKTRAQQAGLAIDWRQGNAEQLDFENSAFDVVICQLGLMLFSKPEQALKEMARVLKPGGYVSCLVQGLKERMLFTSLVMGALLKHAPQLREEGAPTIYAFAKPGVLKEALRSAGLAPDKTQRLAGTFSFASPQAYWDSMTQASGRTGAVLHTLAKEVQDAVRQEVLAGAARHQDSAGAVAIPYEVVLASARKI